MIRVALCLAVAGFLLVELQPAAAQSLRTFVSALGNDDSASCTATAPCRTLAEAVAKTAAGGEVTVLDSGDFGPGVSISKSVSIIAEGVEARIQTQGNAFIVSLEPHEVVILRGLILDFVPGGSSSEGIRFRVGGTLHVQNCVIHDFNVGIQHEPGSTGHLYVSDTLIYRTGTGFLSNGPAESARAVFDRVQMENMVFSGFFVRSGHVIVRNSLVADTGTAGTTAAAFNAGRFSSSISTPSRLVIEGSAAVNNAIGIRASGSVATVVISDSTVTGNTTGLSASGGGAIVSFGNNRIAGNATDGAPTITIAPR